MLETTISYEQLAVDLTAILAQTEKNKYVKAALDFALLEDFDHLYRFSDLLEMEQGISGEKTCRHVYRNHAGASDHCRTPPSV